MDIKALVLKDLKPKTKALGFSGDEVESAAENISGNLTIDETASEEEVAEAVSKAVDAALPFLKLSQKASSRVINEWKKSHSDKDGDEKDPQDGDDKGKTKKDGDDSVPAWAQAIIDANNQMRQELAAMQTEKATASRRGRLESVLKDSGKYGERLLKSFDRMSFKDDAEFEEFLADAQEDLKSYNQERADQGLSTLGAPPSAGSKGTQKKELTDAEADEVAGLF